MIRVNMSSTLFFYLPYPPSIWELYEGWGKTRRLSKKYQKWRRDAGYFIKRPEVPISEPFSILINLKRPNKRQDIDNRCKAILDCLQFHGVVKNDNLCEEVHIRWLDGPGTVECSVCIETVKGEK
jgi:crossover junction endodeoxyribonuclease RusA